MSLYEELMKVDHKDKNAVLAFLNKYKDDDRDIHNFAVINEYYELYSVLDDVLIEASMGGYDEIFQEEECWNTPEEDEYWSNHPTYIRACEIGKMVDTCAAIQDWGTALFVDVRVMQKLDIYSIWKYIDRLVRKYTDKDMECVCDGSTWFSCENDFDQDDFDEDDGSIVDQGMCMDNLSFKKGDKDFERKLLDLRSNLVEIINHSGNLTISFMENNGEKLYKQLVLASENGVLYAAKEGGDNLIVPSMTGFVTDKIPKVVSFTFWI